MRNVTNRFDNKVNCDIVAKFLDRGHPAVRRERKLGYMLEHLSI